MSELDFTIARLRELQIEAKSALDAAVSAVLRLQTALGKTEGELERFEHAQASSGGSKRPAFASPLQGMCYIAIWLATAADNATDGVTEEQFMPYLEGLRDKDGNAPDLDKVSDSLDGGRGKHILVQKGFYKLLEHGLAAVRNHWPRVSGLPEGSKPPL